MGRISFKPTLFAHISDISNKLRRSLWNVENVKKFSKRAKSPKVCKDCGGIEVDEDKSNATTYAYDTANSTTNNLNAKTKSESASTNAENVSKKGIVQSEKIISVTQAAKQPEKIVSATQAAKQPEKIVSATQAAKQPEKIASVTQGSNQPVKIVSKTANDDGSQRKNDVTRHFESEADCGCKEADKIKLQGGKVPDTTCNKPPPVKNESIRLETSCIKLDAGDKIVLDSGYLGMHDCKLSKRKYKIRKFIWKNKANGVEIEAMTLGAAITKMILPDRNGLLKDVLLGFDCPEDYASKSNYYMGSIIGRCANMISNPIFQFDGVCSNLSINRAKKYHYNGGINGFNQYVWHPYVCKNKVIFSHLSKDGSEGYPGEMLTTVSMELTSKNRFEIDIQASTTDPTICNLTQRLLFNLSSHAGGGSQLRKHILHVNGDNFIAYDERGLPIHFARRARDNEYDLSCPTFIQEILQKWKNKDFRSAYVVNRASKQSSCLATRIIHEVSGRTLEVHTNQPIVNIDFGFDLPRANEPLDKRLIGKCKVRYINNSAVCVQPQGYPDAINNKDFPTTMLLPGELYHNIIHYEFGIVPKHEVILEPVEVCKKVDPPRPECCNKLEGDVPVFTCQKDLYCETEKDIAEKQKPIKKQPKDCN